MPSSTGEASRPSASLREVGVFIFFVCTSILSTWPLARYATSREPGGGGDQLEIAWIFDWAGYSARANPFGLFDGSIFHANIFHPEQLTLAYTENFLGLSLPVAPIIWLTSNPILALNLVTIGLYAVGGYATYRLMRELTPYWPAGVVAGLAFTFSPYRTSQIEHTHVIAMHLMPLVLLMLLRLSRNPSRRVVVGTGLLIALQIWSSLTGAAVTLVVIGAWGIWELARRRRNAIPTLGRAGMAVALGLAVAIPVIKPYGDLRTIHPELKHPDAAVLEFSATPTSYLVPSRGNALFRSPYANLSRTYRDTKGYWEKTLFPGFVLSASFMIAIGAIVRGQSRWRARRARRAGRHGRHGRRAGADHPPQSDKPDDSGESEDPVSARNNVAVSTYAHMCLFLLIAAVGFVASLGPRLGATADGMPLPFVLVTKLGLSGFSRVPARFGVLVPFGMAVVVGLALGAAKPLWQRRLLGASLILLTIELLLPTLHTKPVPRITAAHRAIRNVDGAVLGLPTVELRSDKSPDKETIRREVIHLYLATAHHRPIANGYGAFHPLSFWELMGAVQDFPSTAGMRVLGDRGVRTVVVQTNLVDGTRWRNVAKRLDDWPGVRLLERDRGVLVYDISEAAGDAQVRR